MFLKRRFITHAIQRFTYLSKEYFAQFSMASSTELYVFCHCLTSIFQMLLKSYTGLLHRDNHYPFDKSLLLLRAVFSLVGTPASFEPNFLEF